MDDRTRASLLWGLIGGLLFLVLAQGYNLAVGGIGVTAMAGVALAVAVLTAGGSYLVERRVENERA